MGPGCSLAAHLRPDESFELTEPCDAQRFQDVSQSFCVASREHRCQKPSHSTHSTGSGMPFRFKASGILSQSNDANSKSVRRKIRITSQLASLTMVSSGASEGGKTKKWINFAAALGSQTRALMKQVPLLERAGNVGMPFAMRNDVVSCIFL